MKSCVQSWKPEKPMRMRKITIRRTIAIFKNCLISILLVMDWYLESIMKRDIRVSDEVVKIMNRWNNEYLNIPASEGKAEEPSEEELAQIEKFKKNGWI